MPAPSRERRRGAAGDPGSCRGCRPGSGSGRLPAPRRARGGVGSGRCTGRPARGSWPRRTGAVPPSAFVRQGSDAFLRARNEHDGELQPLGGVECQQRDSLGPRAAPRFPARTGRRAPGIPAGSPPCSARAWRGWSPRRGRSPGACGRRSRRRRRIRSMTAQIPSSDAFAQDRAPVPGTPRSRPAVRAFAQWSARIRRDTGSAGLATRRSAAKSEQERLLLRKRRVGARVPAGGPPR